MPVIAFQFNGIEGKRSNQPLKGDLKIHSTPKITEIKEVTLKSLGKKALGMKFEFKTFYTPEVGNITVDGMITFVDDKQDDILAQWKKDQSMPDDVSVEVLNALFRRCLLRVALLAEDLNLPPPLQFPLVKAK